MPTEMERRAERTIINAMSLLLPRDRDLVESSADYQEFMTYMKLERDLSPLPDPAGPPAFESFKANPPSGQLA